MGHRVVSCLVFLTKNVPIARLNARVAVSFYIPNHQCRRDPISSHPFQHFVLSIFFMLAILIGMYVVMSHSGFNLHFTNG